MDGDPGLLTGEAPEVASRSLLGRLSLLSDAPDPRYEKIQQKRYNIDNEHTYLPHILCNHVTYTNMLSIY